MSDYGTLASEFYELDKPEPPPDALEFYSELAHQAGGPIHEPMCGSGRFLLPLLAQGLDVSGSDSSSHMLARCAERARALGLAARLSQQTLESLACEPAPRLLFIPSGSFGLLIDDASVERALEQIYGQLAPGGVLAVETDRLQPARPETSGAWGGRFLTRPDGKQLVFSWLLQYSGAANVTTSLHRYELIERGRLLATEFQEFHVRSYADDEFRARLAKAGFVDVRALAPYERREAEPGDDAVVFLARKA